MLKPYASWALVLPLLVAISGCLYEATLDAKGGATMTATYRLNKDDYAVTKKRMESAAVKLTSSQLVGPPGLTDGVFKLELADATKLPTAPYFRDVKVTRVDGPAKGTKVLTVKLTNDRPLNLPDNLIDRVGKEVKIAITFPGAVVESNGTLSGNTVTWTWGVNQFFNIHDVLLTATYNEAAAAGGEGAKAGS
jgi:hypothetical protein